MPKATITCDVDIELEFGDLLYVLQEKFSEDVSRVDSFYLKCAETNKSLIIDECDTLKISFTIKEEQDYGSENQDN